MAGTAAIRYGLAGNARAFEKQRQRVGKKFRLACASGYAKSRKPVALHGLMTLDQLVRRMAFTLQLDGGIGEIATCGLAVQTVGPIFHPGKQLAARVAGMGGFKITPDFFSFVGSAAQCLTDQLILGTEVPVEGHLVRGGSIRNGIDTDATNAMLTEKL